MNNFSLPGNWGWTPDREQDFTPFSTTGLVPGRVVGQNHHSYTLITPLGRREAKITGAFEHKCTGPEDYPVLGDWTAFDPAGGDSGLIRKVLPRYQSLRRLAPGGSGEVQVLAANMEWGIIVMALDQDYSPARADRYLTLLKQAGAMGLVWLNKADIYPEKAQEGEEFLKNRWPDVPVIPGNALDPGSRIQLAHWLAPGQTLCLLGSSGAGKSTLLNTLAGKSLRKTSQIREWDGKGRHTSMDRVLIPLENGSLIMDHPGLREVGLWAEEKVLGEVFESIEILAAHCRFTDCSHQSEPGCQIQEALETGELDRGLWTSWLRQKGELAALARKADPLLARQERDRWKAINKKMRGFNKEKRAKGLEPF